MFFLWVNFCALAHDKGVVTSAEVVVLPQFWEQYSLSKYAIVNDTTLNFIAFQEALRGYYLLKNENKLTNSDYLTIIDFSKHSSEQRFYFIDMNTFSLVHKTYCSHGKNAGGAMATKFSNNEGILQTSLEFYLTGETYTGKFDLGLRLDGLEYSNSRARSRGVVMHGAHYATDEFLRRNNNVLGRSFRCPAVPKDEADFLIHKIKNGSLMYIYHPDKSYHRTYRILNNNSFIGAVSEKKEEATTI